MLYKHNENQIDEYSLQALSKIKELKLPLAPHVFELWYVYFAKENPELCHAVEMEEISSRSINYQTCTAWYDTYLNVEDHIDNVRSTGSKIQTTINDVNSLVMDVTHSTSRYSEDLQKAASKLENQDCKPEEVKEIVSSVVESSQEILQTNKKLEEELAKQAQVMVTLEHDLNRVRQEAMTDGLTNIANRKAFDERIVEAINGMSSEDNEHATFALILMDIDYFKNFNDKYGHQVGDQVLRLVAQTLVDGIKGRDFVARYGGEEFIIILPNTNQHDGLGVANELRKAVSKKKIVNRHTGDSLGRITLSGGITEYFAGDDQDAIVQRADQALYEAKEKGRNTMVMARVKVAR